MTLAFLSDTHVGVYKPVLLKKMIFVFQLRQGLGICERGTKSSSQLSIHPMRFGENIHWERTLNSNEDDGLYI